MNVVLIGMLLAGAPAWVEGVVASLQAAREARQAPALSRRAELDAFAQAHARRVADSPHAERLIARTSIDEELEAAGLGSFRHVRLHLDMGRGYRDLRESFERSWIRLASSWRHALDPEFDAIGVGTATGTDAWVVFVAILVDEVVVPDDLAGVERRAIEAVNALRREQGLSPLTPDARLTEAARAHSEQMARLNFFAHKGPDGSTAADRVSRAGVRYDRLAENIHASRGFDDPVPVATAGWMDSPEHRRNILDGAYTHTGMGVALAEDGRIYFTQLFLLTDAP